MLQVKRDRFLAGVEHHPTRIDAARRRRALAQKFSRAGRLDLDHFGAKEPKLMCAVWSGDNLRQFEHTYSLKRQTHAISLPQRCSASRIRTD
jgi:hypothetical protein